MVSGKVLYALKELELEAIPKNPVFCVKTNGKAELSINGQRVRSLTGAKLSGPGPFVQCVLLREEERALFQKGNNVISIANSTFSKNGFLSVTLYNSEE